MGTRYLEIDSTYRDRNAYPLSSQFVVNFSESGNNGKLNPIDPVSRASPVLVWNSSFAEGSISTYIDYVCIFQPGGANNYGSGFGSNTVQMSIFTPPDQENKKKKFRQVRGFYNGCTLVQGKIDPITEQGTYPGVPPLLTRRIVDYFPLDLENALFVLDYPLPDFMSFPQGFYIQNPGTLPTYTTDALPKVFIPFSNQGWEDVQKTQNFGSGTDNYYVNYSLECTDLSSYDLGYGELYKIIAFDYTTRLATLDKPTPTTIIPLSPPVFSYLDFNGISRLFFQKTSVYNFVLRKEQPVDSGLIPTKSLIDLDACVFGNSIQLDKLDNKEEDIFDFRGDFIRIKPSNFQLAPWSRPVNEERRITKYISGKGLVAGIEMGGLVIDLGASASSKDGYYVDGILSIFLFESSNSDSAKIVAYNGITKKATLATPLVFVSLGNEWYIRTIVVERQFSGNFTRNYCTLVIDGLPIKDFPADFYFEIEKYSRENSIGFHYLGIPSQQSVCYEVELINLDMPNVVLASGRGGRAIFYPYFYVQFQPISDQAQNKDLICSNNPNAHKALYRVLNTDTSTPLDTPFIKVDGDGMKMIFKFKITDSFLFTLYHPEGDLVKFDLSEQYSPTESNSRNQISACFSFRRIE